MPTEWVAMNLRLVCILAIAVCNLVYVNAAKTSDKNKSKVRKNDRDKSKDLLVTKKAWLDIEVDDDYLGRITIGLFCETVPITCQNFAALARGNWRNDENFGYKNSLIHRVVQDFVIQGGDITVGDGTGGKSIYGPTFADENFYLSHKGPGWVSMANSGTDTNNSQFFITMNKARWLDDKHVVFGKVLEGMDVVNKIGDLDVNEYAYPKKIVRISDCGVEHVKEPFMLEGDGDEKSSNTATDSKKQ
ncbi:peptidyl-prolyl cis-trans isomerase B-like [Glandiceps talaboti]